MSGYLEINNLIDGSQPIFYSYTSLSELDPTQRKNLMERIYKSYRTKQITLRCSCITEKVKMTIAYIERTDTYYLRSSQDEASKHSNECLFYTESSLSSNTISSSGWVIDEKGNYHVTLNTHDYKIRNKKISSNLPLPSGDVDLGMGEISVSKNKASLNQITKIMVTNAWNLYIRYDVNKKGYPTIEKIFEKIYKTESKKFYITNELTLQHVLFDKGKIGRIYHLEQKFKKKSQVFVMLLLEYMIELLEEQKYLINAVNPITKERYKIVASLEIVKYAQRNVIDSKASCVVSGFVKTSDYGKPPEFLSMSLVTINDYGVPIESAFERHFYNLMCENKRLIERPMESRYYPKFQGMLPDGLLIDTEPKTVIEIFGMSEGNTDYHIQREFKINHFNNPKFPFNFWFWDAFKEDLNLDKLPTK